MDEVASIVNKFQGKYKLDIDKTRKISELDGMFMINTTTLHNKYSG
jgi:hypothetical protein